MDYCVRYIDLPYTINGITVMDSTGFYNIYINSRLNFERQKKALIHELQHIKKNDFYSDDSLENIENMG